MKIRIMGKILLGTVLILLLFFSGVGAGIYGITRVRSFGDNQNLRNEQIRAIEELELMVTELSLTYMDIIIDKDNGNIHQERLNYIAKFIQELAQDEKMLKSYVDTEEEIAALDRSFDRIDELLEIGQEELIPAVENFAGEEVFAELDDKLDVVGDEILSTLDSIIASIEVEIEEAEEQLQTAVRQVWMLMIAVLILGTVLGLVISVVNARSIANPLRLLTEGARRFSIGDIELKGMNFSAINRINKRSDELGDMSRAFFKLIEYMQEKIHAAEEIAAGNLDVHVNVSSEEDKLGKALSAMIDSLNELVGQVRSAVEQVGSGSGQVAQASQTLSQGATEQASSLEEISSSVTQIAAQAKENTESAVQANTIAEETKTSAEKGNVRMDELVAAMERINKSADEIQRIIKLIDDIAFQTNLLALNANVEAARAGKYGKGFAVVAEEVRNLAGRSAENVKETTSMVEEAIQNIGIGNELVKKTASQLGEMSGSAAKVAEIVRDIAAASREQSSGLEEINKGLSQIDEVTQSNTASAEESASAAEELAGQAQELNVLVEAFRLRNDKKLLQLKE